MYLTLQIVFSMVTIVMFSNQNCRKADSKRSLGRYLPGKKSNATNKVASLNVATIYQCRHLGKHLSAVTFCRNVSNAAEPNCWIYNETSSIDTLVNDTICDTIIFLDKSLNSTTEIIGSWSSWYNDPSCPDPCDKLNPIQYRTCLRNSSTPISAHVVCYGNEARRRVCEPGECLTINQIQTMNQSGLFYFNNSAALQPLKINFRVDQDLLAVSIGYRKNDETNFNRSWIEYEEGFGRISHNYWMGNAIIHKLTSLPNVEGRLWIRFGDNFANYKKFIIKSAEEGYAMSFTLFKNGDAGDSLDYHKGMKFSTYDKDQDTSLNENCASKFGGGWWFKDCLESNLHGEENPPGHAPVGSGMYWKTLNTNGSKSSFPIAYIFRIY